jgi:cytidine deaminase
VTAAARREQLLADATTAAARAHAPFSRFRVGAAVLGADGRVYTGCNLESATYTMTVHAEAAALCAAQLAGTRAVEVAVVCLDVEGRATNGWPCGLCRQLLAEMTGPACEVHTPSGTRTVAELLPDPFVLDPGPGCSCS